MKNQNHEMLEQLHRLARLHERDAIPPVRSLDHVFGLKRMTSPWRHSSDVHVCFCLN